MKEYGTEFIRNVALVSHSGAGKTSLVETLLHYTGVTNRIGKVEDGTTVADFEEEEQRRRISLSTAVIPCEYDHIKINFLDTPGFTDFVGEVKSALRVADAALVVVDAVSGVEVGTELVWGYCDERKLPRFVVITKMDRENANFERTLEAVQELADVRLVPVQLPMGAGPAFSGVVGLLSMKARRGKGATLEDIPAEYREAAETARMALVEAAAEGADDLIEKYLEGEELTHDEVVRGFKQAVGQGSCAPVFVCSAFNEIGLDPILTGVTRYLPSPNEAGPEQARGKDDEAESLPCSDAGPLAAYVWKTTADPFVGKLTYFRVFSGVLAGEGRLWNQTRAVEERFGGVSVPRGKELTPVKHLHAGDIGVVARLSAAATGDTFCDRGHPLALAMPRCPTALYQVAVTPRTQADSARMGPTLTRLCEEDMTLSWHNEPTTHQTILQGMGDQHIDVAIRRAESKFQVGLHIDTPRVPYRESITRTADSHYRHKKQTGGSGQFGEVYMRVEPLAEAEFEFVSEVVGGAVSGSYMPAIEKGVRGVMQQGVIAGYPVGNVRVAVTDGKEHPVDSKPVAFEIAGREAFKLGIKDAGPVLLEPIMNVRVVVPEGAMGDVLGDLNTRRARVQGM
ncbi:MAG: elongation factor G, partial [Chloroflexi bacterium]|nr:elongation factor G [Chloroflexota bacterium]